MEVLVTTGTVRRVKLQSNHHHQQTYIQRFTGRMSYMYIYRVMFKILSSVFSTVLASCVCACAQQGGTACWTDVHTHHTCVAWRRYVSSCVQRGSTAAWTPCHTVHTCEDVLPYATSGAPCGATAAGTSCRTSGTRAAWRRCGWQRAPKARPSAWTGDRTVHSSRASHLHEYDIMASHLYTNLR